MATNPQISDHTRLVPDTPLPGFYGVLTLQLNVTRYQSTDLGKWVLTVREPTSQVELYRAFVNLEEWEEGCSTLPEAVREALEQMRFLQRGYEHQR